MAPKRATRANDQNPANDPTLVQILDLFHQQTENLAQQQQHQPIVHVVTFKSFQAVNPSEFKGSADLVKARSWLKVMDKAFALVGVEENQKSGFASYFLKGEATYWWETVRTLEDEGIIT